MTGNHLSTLHNFLNHSSTTGCVGPQVRAGDIFVCVSSWEGVTFHTEFHRGEGISKLYKVPADFLHIQVNFLCNLSLCWLLAHPQVLLIKVFQRKIKITFL